MIQRHADKRHALQVLRIETESTACVAFCFHPFKPLLTMVDARGVVRVVNYRPLSSDGVEGTPFIPATVPAPTPAAATTRPSA